MIQINPLKSYIDGGVRAALTTPPSASLVFDLPGKAIWVKGVKLKGTDHTYTFNHDNYITLTNTPDKNNPESEDIKIGVNITTLKNVIDTTYNGGTLALLQEGLNTEERTWQAKILHSYINDVLPTTKNLQINGTNYAIYTTANSLPQFFAPTSLGTTGQILACTSSGLSWIDQIQNTDYRVSQSSTTSNSDYRIILKQGANNNPETDFVRFSEYLTFNPYTKTLKINNIKVVTATDIYVGSTAGLVPSATSAQQNYYLRGDGAWVNIATEMAAANTWRPIKVGNTDALGSGTNTGTLSFIAGTGITLAWDTTNKRIIITNSSPDVNHNTDENVRQVPKTDNVNRPLMMINGSTSAGEQINTSMFSTGIYANASTKMITANGFIKAGSSNNYVLLGGGDHKALSDFSMSGHNHDGRYLKYEGYWTSESGQNIDDSLGMNFTYTSHGAPHHWGTTVTFEASRNSGYRLQLHGTGDNYLFFRNRSSDYGGWHSSGWKQILTNQDTYIASDGTNRGIINGAEVASARHLLINGVTWNSNWHWSGQEGQPSWLWGSNDGANMYVWNPSNFSVNYADSAGNADTVDNIHAIGFLRWKGMQNIGSNAPFQAVVDIIKDTSKLNDGGLAFYSYAGDEYTVLIGSRNDASRHGNALKWGYANKYLWMIRMINGSPRSSDWEKISAGYADSAGSIAWDNVTGKPSSYIPSAHTHSWTSITDKLVAGNEFNIANAGFNGDIWFNYVPINDRSKTASIHTYIMSNGAKGMASVTASGFIKNGSNSNYVLLGDGGHKAESSLRVEYASSAGNADTLDGIDSTKFLRQVVVPNNTENDFNTFSNMTLTGRTDPTTGASLKNAPWSGSGPAGGYGVLTYLFSGGGYGTQMAWGYNSNRIYIRNKYWGGSGVGSVWGTSWDTLALTSDNVASATKLQTPRSIWGQSFDGTANISGTLSGVAHIQFSADNTYNIGSNSAASKYIYTYWLGAKSGQKLELGANNSGYGQGLCIDTNLNVGIGTNTPAYKLHVAGDIYTTTGFKKKGSSDSYVLLGGGGHKAVSNFAMASHDHSRIKGPDARSSNNTPQWYMSNRGSGSITSEFSSQGTSVLGRIYTNLTTFTPWGDLSGDYPVQLAFNLTGMAMRTAANTDAWNGWPSGNIYAGNFYTASDIRYKKIQSNIKVSVKQLAKIPLFNFTWTDVNDNMIHSGTSAQKVKKFLPHIVTGSDKLTLDYATLGTIAGITACKELVTQKSEIEQLKEKVKQLEDKLSKYENTL